MSSPASRSSTSRPLTHTSSRLSHDTRTPTSNGTRRRTHSQFESSIFDGHIATSRMTHPLSSLPPHKSGDVGDGDGEHIYRDHNTTSFEWTIRNLEELRIHVEDRSAGMWSMEVEMADPEALPEVLKRGIVIGEGWYKLDLARTIPGGHSPRSTVREISDSTTEADHMDDELLKTLSLYIAALSFDHQHYTYTASIFCGIKASHENIGNRYAPTHWYWQTSADYEFSANTEYWECKLPKLSQLLANPAIRRADSFTLCVQISSPASETPAFNPPSRLGLGVPRSIIDALSGLFDSKTGDVRFTCLEHDVDTAEQGEVTGGAEVSIDRTGHFGQRRLVSRKRVLYAHSAVLRARGDYFNDLLNGGFSESELARRPDSRHIPVVVDDADFNTVYWMLRFIYVNSLEFSDQEDVRAMMHRSQINRAEVNKLAISGSPLYMGPGEWRYHRLALEGEEVDDGMDARTVKSVSSTGTRASGLNPSSSSSAPKPSVGASKGTTTRSTTAQAGSRTRPGSKTPSVTSTSSTSTLTPSTDPTDTSSSTPSTAQQASQPSAQSLTTRHFVSRHVEADPHEHPCQQPAPASALAIYMLAHRYRLEDLEALARDHILVQMTPDNCMLYLLASYQYEALHREILDFIIMNWVDVQTHPEFLRCIQEVSSGTWGESGGLVLHGLFRRL